MQTPQTCIQFINSNWGVPRQAENCSCVTNIQGSDNNDLTNYRPISVLSCFSKIHERIMYNRLSSYVSEEKILYSKQFDFQSGYSTEHAILQLASQIMSLLKIICIH